MIKSLKRKQINTDKHEIMKRKIKESYAARTGTPTTMDKNNEKNDKFYRKVAFLMYTEMVNFRSQSLKAASKLKPDRGLGTRLPSS